MSLILSLSAKEKRSVDHLTSADSKKDKRQAPSNPVKEQGRIILWDKEEGKSGTVIGKQ